MFRKESAKAKCAADGDDKTDCAKFLEDCGCAFNCGVVDDEEEEGEDDDCWSIVRCRQPWFLVRLRLDVMEPGIPSSSLARIAMVFCAMDLGETKNAATKT